MAARSAHSTQTRMATAYDLFKLGWSTDKIANYWNIPEAEAERRLTIERCNHNGLPSPYGALA